MPRSAPSIVAAEIFTKAAQPVIPVGEGLVLRAWLRRDALEVFGAFQDPAIRRWHVRSADSVEEVEDWVDAWARSWRGAVDANWAVADSRTGRIAGRVSLREMVLPQGYAEVAYWVAPHARGRGVAPRAVAAMTAWAFEVAGFHRLELRHSVHNAQSCRVAAKSGFALEGVNRSAALHEDGWHDMHLHARVRGDRLGEATVSPWLQDATVSRAATEEMFTVAVPEPRSGQVADVRPGRVTDAHAEREPDARANPQPVVPGAETQPVVRRPPRHRAGRRLSGRFGFAGP
ncbi:GNAT family N-acetyltransferase [Nocardia jejuensis]|uniref:GNAT family N-acetyltransferase n=1 Tax=Nocardia jejuensis TaxID=328049 RepID=UPI0008349B05|nr:GNAT family N-acetyltransferase [Nocardia jejuensis]